jgi:hypothetical protein
LDSGIAIGRIADECEQVRDERRINAELFANAAGITDYFASAVDLHHARVAHALRQIFVGGPDGYFLHPPVA